MQGPHFNVKFKSDELRSNMPSEFYWAYGRTFEQNKKKWKPITIECERERVKIEYYLEPIQDKSVHPIHARNSPVGGRYITHEGARQSILCLPYGCSKYSKKPPNTQELKKIAQAIIAKMTEIDMKHLDISSEKPNERYELCKEGGPLTLAYTREPKIVEEKFDSFLAGHKISYVETHTISGLAIKIFATKQALYLLIDRFFQETQILPETNTFFASFRVVS